MLFNAIILYSMGSNYGFLFCFRLLGLVQFKKLILICLWVVYNPYLKACGGFIRKRTDSCAFGYTI